MIAQNKFNKIYIVESLGSNDLHTGTRLYADIVNIEVSMIKGLACELLIISKLSEFKQVLQKIANETETQSVYPVIHMDFHGTKEGLHLSSGDNLDWNNLEDMLRSINILCKNNLLITLSACCGIYLTEIAKPTKPAPFFILIAPTRDISQGEVDEKFKSFYEELLRSMNGDKALKKLESSIISFIHCVQLFEVAYFNYYKRHCQGKARKQRTEKLLTKIITESNNLNAPVSEVRKRIKFLQRNEEVERMSFERYKKIFFMIDNFPENEKRFPIRFEDIYPKALNSAIESD